MLTNRFATPAVETPLDVAAMVSLHHAGWSVGEIGTFDANGLSSWIVSGSNGENLIRAQGETPVEAWICALEQARSLGMLGRSSSAE